jgi:hypothetical protein
VRGSGVDTGRDYGKNSEGEEELTQDRVTGIWRKRKKSGRPVSGNVEMIDKPETKLGEVTEIEVDEVGDILEEGT